MLGLKFLAEVFQYRLRTEERYQKKETLMFLQSRNKVVIWKMEKEGEEIRKGRQRAQDIHVRFGAFEKSFT